MKMVVTLLKGEANARLSYENGYGPYEKKMKSNSKMSQYYKDGGEVMTSPSVLLNLEL